MYMCMYIYIYICIDRNWFALCPHLSAAKDQREIWIRSAKLMFSLTMLVSVVF